MSSSDSAPLRERVNAVLFTVLMITSMFAGTVAFGSSATTASALSTGGFGEGSPGGIGSESAGASDQFNLTLTVDTGGDGNDGTAVVNLTDLTEGTGVDLSNANVDVSATSGDSDEEVNSSTGIRGDNSVAFTATDSTGDTDSTVTVNFSVSNIDTASATETRGVAFEVEEFQNTNTEGSSADNTAITDTLSIETSSSPDQILVSEFGDKLSTAVSDVSPEGTVQIQDRDLSPYSTSSRPSSTFSGVDVSESLTIEAATGTPIIDGGSSDNALVVSGNDNIVTVDGLQLTAGNNNNVIEIRGELLRKSGTTGSSLVIQNSTVEPESNGNTAFGIRAENGNENPVAIGNLTVENVTFQDADSSLNGERGINIQEVSGSVFVNNSTFTDLRYAFQGTGTDGLEFTNNDLSGISTEGVILATGGGTTVDFDPQGNITDATISGNDFSGFSSVAVLFLDQNGDDSTVDFLSGTYEVKNNNFTGMSGQFAIATGKAFTVNNDVDLGISIDASNNYYGSRLGPEVTTDGDGETRSVPDGDYTASDPANIDNDGDVTFRPFRIDEAPGGASVDFDFNNDLNQEVDDARTNVNVTIPGGDGNPVNESSLNVSVFDENTDEVVTIVENGEINPDAGDAQTNIDVNVIESTLNGNNESVEQVALNVTLQEATTGTTGYDLRANATLADDSGTEIFADEVSSLEDTARLVNDQQVNMDADGIRVINDDSNPLNDDSDGTLTSSERAQLEVVLVDRFNNNLTDDSNTPNFDGSNEFSPSSSDNSVSIGDFVGSESDGSPDNDNPQPDSVPVEGSPVFLNVTNTEAELVGISVRDFGGTGETLNSGSADQRFTARIDTVSMTVDSETLPADGTSTVNVTLQIRDSNGDPIQRSGEPVEFSILNRSAAGISLTDGTSTTTTTNSDGEATITLEATEDNVPVEVFGQATSPANNPEDSASFDTVTGAIAGNSNFDYDTETGDESAVVNSTNASTVTLEDAEGNPITGVNVTLTLNNTATFDDGSQESTLETDSNGQVAVDVTAPQTANETFQITASASSGDTTLSEALGADGTVINVTTAPSAPTELNILNSSGLTLTTDDSQQITVETLDEFGNVVTNDTTTSVELISNNSDVVEVTDNTPKTVSDGTVTFTIDADTTQNRTTLSANASDLTNDTGFVVNTGLGNISDGNSQVTFEDDRTNNQTVTVNTTQNASVQLSDSEGTPLGGVTVELTGTNEAGDDVITQTLTTDADGFANTTVDIPTAKSNITLNVSADPIASSPAFNATNNRSKAQFNLTVEADNPVALQFAGSDRAVAAGSPEDVTIQIVDQFGNVNESAPADVTLTSSDTGVIDFSGSDNTTVATGDFANGENTTSITTSNSGGEVTLTAANSSLTNATLNLTASTPASIDTTVVNADTIANSENTATTNSTVVKVQLLNNEDDPIGVDSETVTLFTDTGISLNKTSVVTDATGAAFVQVNATGAGDNLGITASAENFSASGSASVTVTGPAESIRVTTNESTVNSDDDVNVTVEFVDSAGRVVPRDDTVTLGVGTGTFPNGGSAVTVDTGSDFEATTVLTANVSSDTDVTVQAQSPGGTVKGSSTITFEAVPVVLSDPATDVDGDGQLEDVNGDGNLTISDVQALFDSLDSSAVQNNVEEFDFNGDGEVNILDVQALFVQEQNNGGSQTQDLAGDQLEVR